MDRIDLHAHTTHSDGSLRPAALVALARNGGLRALAVTDHDTTAGAAEALEAGRATGVEVLIGVEVTARWPGRAMHLLAYGFDARERTFADLLAEARAGRAERNPRILARLVELGVPVTIEEVRAEAGGEVVGRPHIARALVRKGHAPDAKSAFSLWLKDGGPAFVPAESVEPSEVLSAVRAAGGTAVLAHPRQLKLDGPAGAEALLRTLAAQGLGGVEADHPSHDASERALYRRLAGEIGLVASGGSDFHGDAKPAVRLGVGDGTIEVPYATWEALRARCAALAA
jgi:predicted metal-dependent phosphoesterase TrpH